MNTTNKIIIGLVVIVIIIWGGYYLLGKTPQKSSAETIKIGAIAPLTGAGAAYGEEARNAILLAIDDLNAKGGIAGKKFEVIIEDGHCDGKATASAWEKLTKTDKVLLMLAGHCSSETLTVAPLAARDHILALADLTSATVIPNEGEWVFRNSPTNRYYASKTAEFVLNKGLKRAALFTELKDYPKSYSDEFIKAFTGGGGTIVLDERFAPETKDFRTSLAKTHGLNFDVAVISPQGPETMGLIINQLKELGLEKTTVLNAVFGVKVLDVTGGYLPKNHFTLAPYTDTTMPLTKAFTEAYEKKFNVGLKTNAFYITATYDMVTIRMKNALEACATKSFDNDCLRDHLKADKEINGVAGTITFDENYQPSTRLAIQKIVNGKVQFEPLQ